VENGGYITGNIEGGAMLNSQASRIHAILDTLRERRLILMRPLRIYLACPYSVRASGHNDRWEAQRFECANIAAMRLIKQGFIVFSPISHSHPISLTQPDSENTHELWLGQDYEFLEWCDVVLQLEVPGADDSHGVAREYEWSAIHHKEYYKITMHEIYELEKEEIYARNNGNKWERLC